MDDIPEDLRDEIEQLGWSIELSGETGVWELKAIRGQQSWLYLCSELEDACGAVLEMARRNKSTGSQSDDAASAEESSVPERKGSAIIR